jgi:glycerol-3-phosphate acyltransferase PlsX
MKIVVDAMGGDHAPHEIIHGAVQAARVAGGEFTIILVGIESKIREELKKHIRVENLKIEIVHAPDVIGMDDEPIMALRKKRDSSIRVGIHLIKEKKADAFVSAGSTGAVMAGSLLALGKIEGVARPAIGALIPTESGGTLIIDVGANIDSKPHHLLQFGMMGTIYIRDIFGRKNPKVGLLSIGEENTKGNEVVVDTHELMKTQLNNFYGNIEGRDILRGIVDVVVCDGFVGNIVLKLVESVMGVLTGSLRRHVMKNPFALVASYFMKPSFVKMKKDFDYEEYGGVPLLGINGISIISHGRSSAKAIKNSIFVAAKMCERRVNDHIREKLVLVKPTSNYAEPMSAKA